MFVTKESCLVRYEGKEEKVIIPDGITVIGKEAFEYCSTVKDIVMPDTVIKIEKYAFYGSGVRFVRLSEKLEIIEDYAFSGTPLEEIWLPQGLKRLGSSVFRYCRMIKKASFPKYMRCIPPDTFNDCGKLKELHLPENLTEIGAHAFSGCTAVEQLELPEGLERIKDGAFMMCISFEKLCLPKSLKELGQKAFYKCDQLQTVELHTGVRKFGKGMFLQCAAITKVYIKGYPEDESIFLDNRMWADCYAMRAITAPNIKVTMFHKDWRMWAVVGLADYLSEYGSVEEEILDSYVEELKRHKKDYYAMLLENKNLLQLFMDYQLLSREAADQLVSEALQKKDMEIRAMLLTYQEQMRNTEERDETENQLDMLLNALSL